MKILRSKTFTKAYKKLDAKKQQKVNEAIAIFYNNPTDLRLKNHKLNGNKKGYRAISAGGDLRIIFEEKNGYIEVLMLHVGSHNQVY